MNWGLNNTGPKFIRRRCLEHATAWTTQQEVLQLKSGDLHVDSMEPHPLGHVWEQTRHPYFATSKRALDADYVDDASRCGSRCVGRHPAEYLSQDGYGILLRRTIHREPPGKGGCAKKQIEHGLQPSNRECGHRLPRSPGLFSKKYTGATCLLTSKVTNRNKSELKVGP